MDNLTSYGIDDIQHSDDNHDAGVDPVIDHVYISGVRQAGLQIAALREASITHVLKLYPPAGVWPWPADFAVYDNPISDAAPLPQVALRFGLDFIHARVQAGQPVLVACEHGISRSATFVLAYLLEKGYPLPDAWRLLRARHPRAAPHQMLWESLLHHYQLSYSMAEIWSWYAP